MFKTASVWEESALSTWLEGVRSAHFFDDFYFDEKQELDQLGTVYQEVFDLQCVQKYFEVLIYLQFSFLKFFFPIFPLVQVLWKTVLKYIKSIVFSNAV